MGLTHLTEKGVRMVEVSGKGDVRRTARASGKITLRNVTIERINAGEVEKGNVLTTAQIAATLAVKKTPDLIPLCHPLQITGVDVSFEVGETEIEAIVEASCVGKTGLEMEAITGVSVALLTIWDMVKSMEKDEEGQYPVTRIHDIRVLEKRKELLR
ncbi:MAG: cyclic pyranopterin monophosphate synthase MoaC [Candidatus Hydrothermarchaeaceae archaeon]